MSSSDDDGSSDNNTNDNGDHDALRARLQDSYARQRAQRLTAVQRRVDAAQASALGGGSVATSALATASLTSTASLAAAVTSAHATRTPPPPQPLLELASPELTQVLTELEAMCARHGPADTGVALVQRARALVQRDLREALSSVEQHYTAAFAASAALPCSDVATALATTTTTAASTSDAAAARSNDDQAFTAAMSPLTASLTTNNNDNNNDDETSNKVTAAAATAAVDLALLRQCPAEWQTQDKLAVLRELAYQRATASHDTTQQQPSQQPQHHAGSRRLTLRQSLSSTTALFAECLATLLTCEVVRIYLYDEHDNLHCCATYPVAACQGDPMRGTYVEMMLAKQLHHIVCDKGIAVNGGEVDYTLMHARDIAQIEAERQAKGWASMRSCLIMPILAHTHHGDDDAEGDGDDRSSALHDSDNDDDEKMASAREGTHAPRQHREQRRRRGALGMIHAVNKLAPANVDANHFTSDDEVLVLVCARVLGCMLTRYPRYYFTLRVGAALHHAVYGHRRRGRRHNSNSNNSSSNNNNDDDDDSVYALDRHLPLRVCDADVDDAARMANRAQTTLTPVPIYRAPISSIYETHAHRTRKRRLGNLLVSDQTLSSMAFQLSLVNQSWAAGLADNARMHQQYRELSEQLSAHKLLLRNVLDGLAVARAMGDDAAGMARYLQRLELLGRSESTHMVVELMETTLAHCTTATTPTTTTTTSTTTLPPLLCLPPPPPTSSQATHIDDNNTATGSATANDRNSGDDDTTASPFVRGAEAAALARHVRVVNQPVVATMHGDGPDGVRAYSTDPARKRAQVRFIKAMVQRSGLSTRPPPSQSQQALTQTSSLLKPSSSSSPALPVRASAAYTPSSSRAAAAATTTTTTAPMVDYATRRPFCIK